MRQDSLISVVIPTYNREQYIERAVQSVLEQTYSNLELIIVDDGSTDGTEELVAGMSDPRIRYVRQETNRGASAARNKGVECANGELVAFQDSDDRWYPDKLAVQMEYWEAHPECSLIYSAYVLHRPNGETVRVPYAGTWGNLEGDIFSTLLVNNTVGTPTMLFKKACFTELGGFDEGMECLEDWEMALRFAERYRIGFVEQPLMEAFLLRGGVSSSTSNFYLNRCRMIARYKKALIERGLFDEVVGNILLDAKEWGVLTQVQSMLAAMLSGTV